MNSKLAWVYNKFQETLDYRARPCLTGGKRKRTWPHFSESCMSSLACKTLTNFRPIQSN